MWERSIRYYGVYESMADSRVPEYVVRTHNKRVRAGRHDIVVPAQRYYYRFVFCV